MSGEFSLSQHFDGKDPAVRAIYEHILSEARKFGPVAEEPKKTSIHLVNKSAFAGVMTRKNVLILTVKSAAPIGDPRFTKTEQASASRFHQQIRLTSPDEVDARLIGWLREAYAISG
jgi:hypothetical protein